MDTDPTYSIEVSEAPGPYEPDRSFEVVGEREAAIQFEELTGVPLADVLYDLRAEGATWHMDETGRTVRVERVGALVEGRSR